MEQHYSFINESFEVQVSWGAYNMNEGAAGYWTPKRQDIMSWFKRNAPSLGELYEGALRIVFDSQFPGRVRFVSHAVREIRNRLPDAIAGPVSDSGRPVQYYNRCDEIAKMWQSAGLSIDGDLKMCIVKEDLPSGTVPKVAIPYELYKAIARLVGDHLRAGETKREAAKRLYEAISSFNKQSEAFLRIAIDNWLEMTEWFVHRAHERGARDVDMGTLELQERFKIFENCLAAMLREFYKTMEELDEILEEANS